MDHYQTLGLSRNATKEEIKEAFRRSALLFHPDRHSHSTQVVRDRALLRFKQASQAYEVLVDERKRADYDSRRCGGGSPGGSTGRPAGSSAHRGYGYGGGGGRFYGPGYDWGIVFRYLMSRSFLRNAALASVSVGAAIVIKESGDAIWKMKNAGKSFEEAMESIEKVKVHKEKG